MKIRINRREIEIFAGATLADAVLKYSARSYRRLLAGKITLMDRYGNITEPDGPVHDGQVVRLQRS